MSKKIKILAAAGAAFAALLLCASLSINMITFAKVQNIEMNTVKADNAREDGVIIADEYEVRSTTQISDAYKSGDDSSLSELDKATLKTASKILGKITKKDMTEYEKEKAVYEWMCKNIEHDEGMMTVVRTTKSGADCPQGVLASKKAICVGFATTFRMFMQMLDIDCMVVHDTELAHTWDLVKIDGSYYHTDIYADAPYGIYAHFNLTDTMRGNDWSWDTEFYPRANSYEYCYCVLNAKTIHKPYDIPKLLKKSLDDREYAISYKLNAKSARNKMIVERVFTSIQAKLEGSDQYGSNYFDWNSVETDDGYIFCVTVNYNDEELPEDIDEKTEKKINKAIDKAFGELTYENALDEGEVL